MMNKDKILIAKIIAVHGIKGNIKVKSFAENEEDIFTFKQICDDTGAIYKLKLISYLKNSLIIKVNNIIDRNEAEKLIGRNLYISREEFSEIGADQFYYADLINIDVLDTNRNKIGTVKAVHNFGAGDIIEIDFLEKKHDNYFLFNKEKFPIIDVNNKFIVFVPELP